MALAALIAMFIFLTMMNKKHLRIFQIVLAFALAMFSGCESEEIEGPINENALQGTWYSTDAPQEFWRFDSNHTGETWDESEDVQEGEGSRFNWSTQDDQLRLDIYGQMGQHVYYDYTISDQTFSTFTRTDIYGNSRKFIKR